VCQVVNEASFALAEGVGSAEDIDAGMLYGLNYPRGILAWADEIGLDHVLAVLFSMPCSRSGARSATELPHCCARWCGPAGSAPRPARGSSATRRSRTKA
jgi:3-hydroxyacyl-CoA dehydrogenase